MDGAAFEQVHEAFQDFQAYLGPVFGRRESQDHSRYYLQAPGAAGAIPRAAQRREPVGDGPGVSQGDAALPHRVPLEG